MAFYPDFSEYRYHPSGVREGTVNIGWLDASREFPTGPTPKEFLHKLWQYCKMPLIQTRGIHDCNICKTPIEGIQKVEFEGEVISLGTAELRVFGRKGVIYASPTLIFHYVKDHLYRPPDEFVDAVIFQPAPPDPEYKRQLLAFNLN